jgi:hypothetical protein
VRFLSRRHLHHWHAALVTPAIRHCGPKPVVCVFVYLARIWRGDLRPLFGATIASPQLRQVPSTPQNDGDGGRYCW